MAYPESNCRSSTDTYLDRSDSVARALLAGRLGVTDGMLLEAIRMVGSKVSSITAYLAAIAASAANEGMDDTRAA